MARILELLLADDHQRVLLTVADAAVFGELVGVFFADQLVGDKIGKDAVERKPAVGRLERCGRSGLGGGSAFSHEREYKRIS